MLFLKRFSKSTVLVVAFALSFPALAANSMGSNSEGRQQSDVEPKRQVIRPAGSVPLFHGVSPRSPFDAAAMPVDTPSTESIDAAASIAAEKQIEMSFRRVYVKAKKPRIAVYWNREVTDRLSQWSARFREVRDSSASFHIDSFDTGEPKQPSTRKFSGNASVGAKTAQYFDNCHRSYRDGRRDDRCYQTAKLEDESGDRMHSRTTEFEFNAGFMAPLINNGVTLVDRSMIQRLAYVDQLAGGLDVTNADRQVVEINALRTHADYLIEIVYVSNGKSPIGMDFLVSTKKVADGRVVSVHRFRPQREDPVSDGTGWVAGPNGFVKSAGQDDDVANRVGRQLAYETMDALSRVL